jgi:hypothetical protein
MSTPGGIPSQPLADHLKDYADYYEPWLNATAGQSSAGANPSAQQPTPQAVISALTGNAGAGPSSVPLNNQQQPAAPPQATPGAGPSSVPLNNQQQPAAPPQATPGAGPSSVPLDLNKRLPVPDDLNKRLPVPNGPGVQVNSENRRLYKGNSTVTPHISIYGTPEFHAETNNALKKISEGPDGEGQKLINGFRRPARKGKRLTIVETGQSQSQTIAKLNEQQAARSKYRRFGETQKEDAATKLAQKGFLRIKSLKGEGANAETSWNPYRKLELDDQGRPTEYADDETGENSKSYLTLANQMIHARRIVRGTYSGSPQDTDRQNPSTPAGQEEMRAIGLNTNRVSENSIRRENSEPERSQYAPANAGLSLDQIRALNPEQLQAIIPEEVKARMREKAQQSGTTPAAGTSQQTPAAAGQAGPSEGPSS